MRGPTTTRRVFLGAVASVGGLAAGVPASAAGSSSTAPHPGLFMQVWQAVNDGFFDPDFRGVDWPAMRSVYGPQAARARSREEQGAVINRMLGGLRTSHTRLFTPDEPAYYQLLGVFLPRSEELRQELDAVFPEGGPHYSGIGIVTWTTADGTFVRAVFDGGPADAAGLLVGDRLIAVDGQPFHPIRSFAGKTGRPVALRIQRTPSPDSRQTVTVTPALLDGAAMFLDAMQASMQVIPRAGRRIGYVHVWSYAGQQYQTALEQALLFGRLADAEALVLDLRDGWGGASPSYLNLFTQRVISVTGIGRRRGAFTFRSGWDRPVVLLVNGGTRSGKELLAYGFRRHGIGPIVGTTTGGAVVEGFPSIMVDGSLLYLAVGDVFVDGDTRLEGVGVAPDIEVPFSPHYAQGADPQRDRAVTVAVELLAGP